MVIVLFDLVAIALLLEMADHGEMIFVDILRGQISLASKSMTNPAVFAVRFASKVMMSLLVSGRLSPESGFLALLSP